MTRRVPLFNCRASLSTIHHPLITLLLVLVGCGTGEYEKRLNNRASQLPATASFNELYAPQVLPGTPVSVRLPQIFKDAPLVEGVPVGGQPVDMRRVQPGGLATLPGLKLTYEGFVENADGKLPYYCYVGAINMAGGQGRDPSGALRAELNAKPHQELSEWTDFQAQSPAGQATLWKKLRFVGNQEFSSFDKTGRERFASMPGVLEIYLHKEAGYFILIGWRAPTSIEPTVNLAKWAPPVAGCVSVKK